MTDVLRPAKRQRTAEPELAEAEQPLDELGASFLAGLAALDGEDTSEGDSLDAAALHDEIWASLGLDTGQPESEPATTDAPDDILPPVLPADYNILPPLAADAPDPVEGGDADPGSPAMDLSAFLDASIALAAAAVSPEPEPEAASIPPTAAAPPTEAPIPPVANDAATKKRKRESTAASKVPLSAEPLDLDLQSLIDATANRALALAEEQVLKEGDSEPQASEEDAKAALADADVAKMDQPLPPPAVLAPRPRQSTIPAKTAISKMSAKSHSFVCTEPGCDKAFIRIHNLQTHMRTHKPDLLPFACDECTEAFDKVQELKEHVKFIHVQPRYKPYSCPACRKAFTKMDGVRKHCANPKSLQKCQTAVLPPDDEEGKTRPPIVRPPRPVVHTYAPKNSFAPGPSRAALTNGVSAAESGGDETTEDLLAPPSSPPLPPEQQIMTRAALEASHIAVAIDTSLQEQAQVTKARGVIVTEDMVERLVRNTLDKAALSHVQAELLLDVFGQIVAIQHATRDGQAAAAAAPVAGPSSATL